MKDIRKKYVTEQDILEGKNIVYAFLSGEEEHSKYTKMSKSKITLVFDLPGLLVRVIDPEIDEIHINESSIHCIQMPNDGQIVSLPSHL